MPTSSPSFDSTIDCKLAPSMRGLQWVFALHVIPVALLPFAMSPGPALAVAVGAFGVSWLWLRRHPALGFGKRALRRLQWSADGSWMVEDGEGRKSEAQLLGSSCVHPRLMVLDFKLSSGRRQSRVLLGDEAEPELLRRVRARLLDQGPAAAA